MLETISDVHHLWTSLYHWNISHVCWLWWQYTEKHAAYICLYNMPTTVDVADLWLTFDSSKSRFHWLGPVVSIFPRLLEHVRTVDKHYHVCTVHHLRLIGLYWEFGHITNHCRYMSFVCFCFLYHLVFCYLVVLPLFFLYHLLSLFYHVDWLIDSYWLITYRCRSCLPVSTVIATYCLLLITYDCFLLFLIGIISCCFIT